MSRITPFRLSWLPGSAFLVIGWLYVVGFLLISGSCSRQDPNGITETELSEHVFYLASDSLEGRRVGSAGVADAERYIAEQFETAGLEVLPGENDYFLEFALSAYAFESTGTLLSAKVDETSRIFRGGDDFRPFDFSGTGSVMAEVVFAGYGITAPEYGYDDYDDLDVKGKVVLIMRHEPRENDPDSEFTGEKHTNHAFFATKAETAERHGAVAMLLYTDPLHHDHAEDLRPVEHFTFEGANSPDTVPEKGIPALRISRSVAMFLLGTDNAGLKALQRSIDDGMLPSKYEQPEATVEIEVSQSEEPMLVEARNVAGYVRGRTDEWIVIGAHHDHIGSYQDTYQTSEDSIYNGADDNSSGTSLVIELAEYFAGMTEKPDRNLMFITFAAEEIGLFGSRAIEKYNWIDLNTVVTMLNFDMVGRNSDSPYIVYGDGYAIGMTELINSIAGRYSIAIDLQGREYDAKSDHHPFYERKIPFLMFFSGVHNDYHGVGDHADLLDYVRMSELGDFSVELIRKLSAADPPPAWK